MACIFSETVSSEFSSRAVVAKSSSLGQLSVETVAINWSCILFR